MISLFNLIFNKHSILLYTIEYTKEKSIKNQRFFFTKNQTLKFFLFF